MELNGETHTQINIYLSDKIRQNMEMIIVLFTSVLIITSMGRGDIQCYAEMLLNGAGL